jgi:UDP-N-acetylglucosamine 2-epimerase (non-hydrolysing)
VVFPVHPRTRRRLEEFGLLAGLQATSSIRMLDPLGYLDSLSLVDAAAVVLTDSGGLQEESTFLRVPCLTLRPSTERPVTITHGSNRLTTLSRMHEDVVSALARERGSEVPPLWDGHAAERIAEILLDMTGRRA